MNSTKSFLFAGILAAFLTVANSGNAQTTVVQTTGSDSAGTITEFSPDTIVIHSETAPEPIRYVYSKTTTYVDEDGNPVSMETVKSGLPVTVHYVKDGDRLVASRVIVRRVVVKSVPAAPVIEEKKTTTTTTITGGK